jgi:xylulokinase
MTSVLAFDLGTGGCKAAIWRQDAVSPASAVADYPTHHPGAGLNVQRPMDWWDAVVRTAGELRTTHPVEFAQVRAIVISGHSLGVLPLDADGRPLQERTPIWSDTRGESCAAEFFQDFDEDEWYLRTGNGFSRGLYPVFKAMWLREHHPRVFANTAHLVGCKDFINLRLTGRLVTDHSYASGSGAYDLETGDYADDILAHAGLERSLFPTPIEAHEVVGDLLPEVASVLGLPTGVVVFAGGVDNACMAAGSRLTSEGRAYASLGSSSWITVASEKPVLDAGMRPFVFRHLLPGHHISALSTFSTGTSFDWVRELMFPEIEVTALLDEAMGAPIGAGGATFIPTLAGGTPLEGGSAVLGGFAGLSLGTTRAHVIRSVMEGISMSMARSLRALQELTDVERPVLITGGGSGHAGWNGIYAATMDADLYQTGVSRDAATLGAASAAFVGLGAWSSYGEADRAHRETTAVSAPQERVDEYRQVQEIFRRDSALNARRADAGA